MKCPVCNSFNTSTQRRLDGLTCCLDCGFKDTTDRFMNYRLYRYLEGLEADNERLRKGIEEAVKMLSDMPYPENLMKTEMEIIKKLKALLKHKLPFNFKRFAKDIGNA